MGRKHKKKIKTEKQLLAELKKLKFKPPRTGVHNTKVFKDKKKYSRKKKHKEDYS